MKISKVFTRLYDALEDTPEGRKAWKAAHDAEFHERFDEFAPSIERVHLENLMGRRKRQPRR